MIVRSLLVAAAVAGLAGCTFQNRDEREADRITQAVINNDLKPVGNDIAKGIATTRVKVAEWSDELGAQGKLLSVKETAVKCKPGWRCFDVKFQKHDYVEQMRFNNSHKVVDLQFHMVEK
ncbi:MAG TPA: hypothetical protein VKR56_04860 [Candidatus Cybelea sp.]|nr:hypothetical protein [Candidatus Cybelea sp.]